MRLTKLQACCCAAALGLAAAGPTRAADAGAGWTPPAKRMSAADGWHAQVSAMPHGATPRLADGKPDLSGAWNGGFPFPGAPEHRRANNAFEPDQAVMQRAAWTHKPVYKPEYWTKVEGLDFSTVDTDPTFSTCLPEGSPRNMSRSTIIRNDKQMWIYLGREVRVIPLDGRKLTDDDADQTTFNGVSSGHWDGDTLVIDSTGFTDESWWSWVGYFHSDRMTLQERFRRDGDVLYYQYTLTDPKVLAEPYTSIEYIWRLNPNPNAAPIEPLVCKPTQVNIKGVVDRYFRG